MGELLVYVMRTAEPESAPQERTGKCLCVQCLSETERAVYFRNDFLCDACVEGPESVSGEG